MNGPSDRATGMLTIRDSLPEGLLDCSAKQLGTIIDGPTLIELPGERAQPLFVSILMHGNEDVGLGAIQRILSRYRGSQLPRSLMLLIGNVEAAAAGRRRLDHQPDFNRVWPGTLDHVACAEARMMSSVHARVIERGAFAAIDLHNNTGRNPHYSVICSDDARVLGLAALFTRRAVLFRGVPGTQTASFTGHVPAMTAECGRPGSAENEAEAARFVESVMTRESLSRGKDERPQLDLYHTLGVVRVHPHVSLSSEEESADLGLDPAIDRLNFVKAPAGQVFGCTRHPMPVAMIDETGRDVARDFFAVEDGALRLTRAATPAMLTGDPRIVRQDCLGYLMEELSGN